MVREVRGLVLIHGHRAEVNVRGLGQTEAGDRLAVVGSAVHDQREGVVRHAGVASARRRRRRSSTCTGRRRPCPRCRSNSGSTCRGWRRRRPWRPRRSASGTSCRSGFRPPTAERAVDACRRAAPDQRRRWHCPTEREGITIVGSTPAMLTKPLPPAVWLRDDHADRAVELRVLRLDGEPARAAVHHRDLPVDGGRVHERRFAAVHDREVARSTRRWRDVADAVVHQHHVTGQAARSQCGAELRRARRVVPGDRGRRVDRERRSQRRERRAGVGRPQTRRGCRSVAH